MSREDDPQGVGGVDVLRGDGGRRRGPRPVVALARDRVEGDVGVCGAGRPGLARPLALADGRRRAGGAAVAVGPLLRPSRAPAGTWRRRCTAGSCRRCRESRQPEEACRCTGRPGGTRQIRSRPRQRRRRGRPLHKPSRRRLKTRSRRDVRVDGISALQGHDQFAQEHLVGRAWRDTKSQSPLVPAG